MRKRRKFCLVVNRQTSFLGTQTWKRPLPEQPMRSFSIMDNAVVLAHGFIQKQIFDEVVDGVTQHARNIKVADGFNPESQMGPLVSEEQLNRVLGFLEAGRAMG
jgi:hypothetical protein